MRRRWSAAISGAGILFMAVGLDIASAQEAPGRLSSPTSAAPARSEENTALPSNEREFVSQAAMSNMAAIQLGHIATKRAQHAGVQKFAQTTIEDHLKAQKQLLDAAYGAGIKWPTTLDERSLQLQQRLSKLNNAQFDREYMKAMIDRHRDIERMLAAHVTDGGTSARSSQSRPAGDAGSDESALTAKMNQWAAGMLPEVRAHLKEAEQVFGALGQGE